MPNKNLIAISQREKKNGSIEPHLTENKFETWTIDAGQAQCAWTSIRCYGRKRSESSDLAQWKFIHTYMKYARAAQTIVQLLLSFGEVRRTLYRFIHTTFLICWVAARNMLGVVLNIFDFLCVVCGTARRQSSLIVSHLFFFLVFVCVSLSICLPTCQTCCLSDDSGRDEIGKEEAKQMK